MLVKRQVPRDLATSRCNYNNSYAPQVLVGEGAEERPWERVWMIYTSLGVFMHTFST